MICPRCSRDIAERFYGPCIACRLALRQMTAPPPDKINYRRTDKADGTMYVAYVGKVTFRDKEETT